MSRAPHVIPDRSRFASGRDRRAVSLTSSDSSTRPHPNHRGTGLRRRWLCRALPLALALLLVPLALLGRAQEESGESDDSLPGFEYREVGRWLDRAAALAESIEDSAARRAIWLRIAAAHRRYGNRDRAYQIIDSRLLGYGRDSFRRDQVLTLMRDGRPLDAEQLIVEIGDPGTRSEMHLDLARLHLRNGRLEEAEEAAAEAYHPIEAGVLFARIAVAHLGRRRFVEAARVADRIRSDEGRQRLRTAAHFADLILADQPLPEPDSDDRRLILHDTLSLICTTRAGQGHTTEALRLAQRIGDPFIRATLLLRIARRSDAGPGHNRRTWHEMIGAATAAASRIESPPLRAWAYASLAEIAANRDDRPTARDFLARAIPFGSPGPEMLDLAEATPAIRLLVAFGRIDDATRLAAMGQSNLPAEIDRWHTLARALLRHDHHQPLRQLFDRLERPAHRAAALTGTAMGLIRRAEDQVEPRSRP